MNTKGQLLIYIVEDNFVFSLILRTELEDHYYSKITTFSSGEECIEMLDNNPDIILIDYNLDKGLNGLETFKIIHSKKPRIPVIVISSQLDAQVVADFLHLGAFDYIEKKNGEQTIIKLKESIIKAINK